MMFIGTWVPSFDVAMTRTTSASANVAPAVLEIASFSGASTLLGAAGSNEYQAGGAIYVATRYNTSSPPTRTRSSTADTGGIGRVPSGAPVGVNIRTRFGPPTRSTT